MLKMHKQVVGQSAIVFWVLALLFISLPPAFSHGEDQPGPHGGHIRMPGAFHTEVVPDGKNKAKIYLLDIGIKNPSVKGKVEARLGKKAAACAAEADHFLCVFPKGSDLSKKGVLSLRAEREGSKGSEATYELPLRHKSTRDHSAH